MRDVGARKCIFSLEAWTADPDWRNHLRNPGANQTRWYAAFANGTDIGAGEHGLDFIYFYAFKFARRYDPFAILYYNDYNEDSWFGNSPLLYYLCFLIGVWRYFEKIAIQH